MNPRAVAAWSGAALAITLSTGNPIYRCLVLLVALNLLVTLRRQGARLRPLLAAVTVAGLLATLITALVSHTGTDALVTLPAGLPVLGGPITLEALVFGLSTATGIAAAVLSAATLTVVVEPHELVDALPAPLARTGAAVGTALNLIPSLARSAAEIRDAQRMRGWRPARVREWPDIAVPVVLTALESSMSLAEAMEARGYGGGRRTHFHLTRWQPSDTVVTGVSAAAAVAFLALRFTGIAIDWYPFPALSLPGVSLAGVACCLALAVPLLPWRR